MMTTRGDYEVMSSGPLIWPLSCALLLLFGLAPFAKDPLPADRLANLAMSLDDPTVTQGPAIVTRGPREGAIRIRSNVAPTGEALQENDWQRQGASDRSL